MMNSTTDTITSVFFLSQPFSSVRNATAFATLAGVFQAIPGGTIFGLLFYFLLFFAAVTSSTSILEGTVAFLTEEKGWERKKTLVICQVFQEVAENREFYTVLADPDTMNIHKDDTHRLSKTA